MGTYKGLGRGLDSFFKEVQAIQGADYHIFDCPVSSLVPGRYQPRTFIDPQVLEDLAASIRAHGLVQPITVRNIGDDRYEIIAGERRWRACQLAGLTSIPAIVKDVPDDVALPLAIIENVQREALTPIDEARAIKRLIDEFELTHQEVSESLGRSRTAITNLLRLLALNPDVIQFLQDGCIQEGHARAMLSLSLKDQIEVARIVVDRELSVRQTELLVRETLKKESSSTTKSTRSRLKALDADAQKVEESLSDTLCAPVSLAQLSNGSFRITIHYDNLEQIDDFLARVGVLVS